MNSGILDTRIVFQVPVETSNDIGGVSVSWSTQATIWGGIIYAKGNESDTMRQLHAEAEAKVIVRHSSLTKFITPKWRALIASEVFRILSVIPVPGGRPKQLELIVKQEVDR